MARSFDGVDDFGSHSSAGLSSYFPETEQGTIACWYKAAGASPTSTEVYKLQPIVADTGGFLGLFRGTIGGADRIWAFNWDGNEDRTPGTYSAGTWIHLVWRRDGLGNLQLWTNGTLASTTLSGDTTSLAGSVIMGSRGHALLQGDVAELAFWSTAIPTEDIASLARGVSPLLISKYTQTAYWPLWGQHSPEIEYAQGFSMSMSGTTVTPHPPIFYPDPMRLIFPAGAAPPPPDPPPPATPTVIALTCRNNYHSLALELSYTADPTWEPNTVTVSGRVQKNSVWEDIHDLVPHAQGQAKYYGRVFGCQEGIAYPVEITWTRRATDDNAVLETVTTSGTFTTRTSPVAANTHAVYISPTGNDTTGLGTSLSPKKTIIAAAAVAGCDTIILKDGDYNDSVWDFDNWAGTSLTFWNGTATAYKCIKAENEGLAVVKGGRAMTGSWTRDQANVYYHTLTGFTEASNPSLGPSILRRLTGVGAPQGMTHYKNLTDLRAGTPVNQEGFCIDWVNLRIYVRTPTDVTPTSGQYEASSPTFWLFKLQQCSFVILENIKFEMFGQAERADGGQYTSVYTSWHAGLLIDRCNDIVLRGLQTVSSPIKVGAADVDNSERITVEDCLIEDWDPWAFVTTSPTFSQELWNYLYNSFTQGGNTEGQVRYSVICNAAGTPSGDQMVIRRNTIKKCFQSITLGGTGGRAAFDVYQNTLERVLDDAIEVDGFLDATGSAGTNGAIWHNIFTNTSGVVSFSPFGTGPAWVIGNQVSGYWFWFIRKGPDSNDPDPTDGKGWTLVYNNTWLTTFNHSNPNTAVFGWSSSGPQGNSVLTNNIASHTSAEHTSFSDGTTVMEGFPPYVTFRTNAFYSTRSNPVWQWKDTNYPTMGAMDAAVSDTELLMDNNVDGNASGVNPLPNGINGAVNSALPFSSAVKGITNIAANLSGVLISPLPLGYFPRWVGDSTADPTDTTPPSQPTNLVATPNDATLTIVLTWSASTDAESGVSNYRIYRDGALIQTVSGATLTYSDTGRTPGVTYTYQVAAVNGVNLESTRASVTSSVALDTAPTVTPIPVSSRLMTFYDLVDLLKVHERGGASAPENEELRYAAWLAYEQVLRGRKWKYYEKEFQLRFATPVTTGTITYTNTTRLVQFSGAPVLPADAVYYRLILDGVVCDIKRRYSATLLQLTEHVNPGKNLVAGTTYTLFKTDYQLPADFQEGQLLNREDLIDLGYVTLADLSRQERVSNVTGGPWHFTIMHDPHEYARKIVRVYGYPTSAETLKFVYGGEARDLKLYGSETRTTQGTVTAQASAPTIVGSGTAFATDMIGAILRVGDTTNKPTGRLGSNPYNEQWQIEDVASATSLTLGPVRLPVNTYTTVKYTISDPLDMSTEMLQAVLNQAMRELAKMRKDWDSYRALGQICEDSLAIAKTNDNAVSWTGAQRGYPAGIDEDWLRSKRGTVTVPWV